MANLTGQPINTSYAGLIKTTDNAGIDGTFKQLTDGLGTNIPIEVSNADLRILSNQIQLTDVAQVNGFSITDLTMAFGGAIDFSAATVTGLPGGGGAAGLVAGTGTDSMKSADSLTTNPNIASATNNIAIGNGNTVDIVDSIAIGTGNINSGQGNTIMLGKNWSQTYGQRGIFIGNNTTTKSVGQNDFIVIGHNTVEDGNGGIVIGNNAGITGASNSYAIAIGFNAQAGSDNLTDQNIAIGYNAVADATVGAVAIGPNVTAAIAETVSIKALEVQTDSTPTTGGIIMSDAGGTDRRINIDASGNLQVDSNTINKAFNIPAFTVPTGPPATDTVYAVTTIPANTFTIGDVLEFRSMEQRAALDNICYESYFFSDTAQTVGSPPAGGTTFQQAGIQSSSNGKLYYQKTLYIGATGTAVWNYGQPNDSYGNLVESGDPIEAQAIDWTVDQYFYFQAFNDSATGTVQNYGTVLRKIN